MEYICNEEKRECVGSPSPPVAAALALFASTLSKEQSPGVMWQSLREYMRVWRRWWSRSGSALFASAELPSGFADVTEGVVRGIAEFYKAREPEWGEYRHIFNLDKCEYIMAEYAYAEAKKVLGGAQDWADWADTGALEFAVLIGVAPKVPSPLGFYERYWGRWAGDRIAAVGDRTGEFKNFIESCEWVDLTLNANIATAELYMSLASASGGKRYRDLTIWILRRLHKVTTSMPPEDYRLSIAKKTVELGSYREAFKHYAELITSEHLKYCTRAVERLDVPFVPLYIGEGCLQPSYDSVIHMLDDVRPFDAVFGNGKRRRFRL